MARARGALSQSRSLRSAWIEITFEKVKRKIRKSGAVGWAGGVNTTGGGGGDPSCVALLAERVD